MREQGVNHAHAVAEVQDFIAIPRSQLAFLLYASRALRQAGVDGAGLVPQERGQRLARRAKRELNPARTMS